MSFSASDVVTVLLEELGARMPGAWVRDVSGAFAVVTGVPMPTMNGVWVLDDAVPASTVLELVEDVRQRTDVFGVQLRPVCAPGVADALTGAGLVFAEDIPLMTLPTREALVPPRAVDGLDVRVLAPDEFGLALEVGARGFEAPPELYASAMDSLALVPGSRCLLGSVDGVEVTTAVVIPTEHGSIGIFNVATPIEYRGHGYGAAITAAAIEFGFESGATWSWLQASSEGYGVYERLGFNTVERWPFYLPSQ